MWFWKTMDILFREKNIFELIKRITKCRTIWAGIGKQTDKKIIWCDLHADMVAVVSKSRSHRRGFTTRYTTVYSIWNSTKIKQSTASVNSHLPKYTGEILYSFCLIIFGIKNSLNFWDSIWDTLYRHTDRIVYLEV